MSTIERDFENLNQAHALKDQANKEFSANNLATAMMLYHKCLLHARGVAQLSCSSLQLLARTERNEKETEEEKETDKGKENSNEKDKNTSHLPNTPGRSRIDSTTRGQELKEESLDLMAKCYNNLAACLLKKVNTDPTAYERVILYCDKVLEIEPKNDKAVYRKALAHMKSEKYEKATELFEQCNRTPHISELIAECNTKIVIKRKKRDAEIRANFAKSRRAELEAEEPPAQRNGHAMNGSTMH